MSFTVKNLPARALILVLLLAIEFISGLVLATSIDSSYYYVVCVLFNLITFLVVVSMRYTRLTGDMAILTAIQLGMQVGGWFLWVLKYPPSYYNACIHIIVPLTFFRLLWATSDDGYNKKNPYRLLVSRGISVGAFFTFGVFK
jgi:hypothetical protein